MYFKSRAQAGDMLAEQLFKYRYENTAVMALSDGAVIVGARIAAKLHCVLTMLLTEPIQLPGEPEAVASINQEGGFTYNNDYSQGQLEEFEMEYHHYIEQQKMQKLSGLHRLLGQGGLIKRELLQGHNIILVSDGLSNPTQLDSAADYLKPIKAEKLIIATPFANVSTVDRMHLMGDEIHCLSVIDNFMGTNHYYEDNTMPSHETIVKTIESIVLNWQ